MDIQSLSLLGVYDPALYALQKNRAAAEFRTLLEELCGSQEVNDMKNEIAEKFGVSVHVVNYACEKTDNTAESYDTAMLQAADYEGCGNVVISKQTLLRMEQDEAFRQKVYDSIEDMKGTGNLSGGVIKSSGAFIHEDGSAGYWVEFDWGDDESSGRAAGQNNKTTNHTHHIGACLHDTGSFSAAGLLGSGVSGSSNVKSGTSTSGKKKNSRYVMDSDFQNLQNYF